jgi:polyisoprenoid-binding protein YceI
MKKIIIIVVVLAVILLAVSMNKKSDKVVNTDTNQTPPVATPIVLTGVTLADGTYSVAPADASINWTGRKVILKNWIDTGTIAVKEASLEVKDGVIVSNKFVIDMTTIAAATTGAGGGQDKLSTHLKSADFFNVELYPTSTFVAKEFTAGSTANSFIIKGDLTIKDVTKEISIPAIFTRAQDGTIVAKGSVDVDRTVWDIRYGSGKFFSDLGDNVIDDMFNIAFELTMKATPQVQ